MAVTAQAAMTNMSVCERWTSNIHPAIRWDSLQCHLSVSRTRFGKVRSDAQYPPSPDQAANHMASSSCSSPAKGSLHDNRRTHCWLSHPLSSRVISVSFVSVSPLRKKSSSSWGARPSACSIFMVMLKEKSSLCLSNRPVKSKRVSTCYSYIKAMLITKKKKNTTQGQSVKVIKLLASVSQ